MHSAEGVVGRRPDLHPGGVRREDRAADVVGADEVDLAALDHRDRLPPVPDIFADQRAGGLIVFGDVAALAQEDGVDGDRAGLGQGAVEIEGFLPKRRCIKSRTLRSLPLALKASQ